LQFVHTYENAADRTVTKCHFPIVSATETQKGHKDIVLLVNSLLMVVFTDSFSVGPMYLKSRQDCNTSDQCTKKMLEGLQYHDSIYCMSLLV